MPRIHTALEAGDVIVIPQGSGASVTFIEKSGRRSRVVIESDAPITLSRASEHPNAATGGPIARRPIARTTKTP